MKKFLIVLGAVFAALIIVVAVLAIKGVSLDRDAGVYADDSVKAIARTWDEQALLQRASPELLAVTHGQTLDELFIQLRQLGKMTHYDGSKSNSTVFFSLSGGWVTAVCLANAQF